MTGPFELLFPGWSNPLAVAGLVAARALCNCALTVLAARSVGRDAALTRAVAAATVISAGMTVLLLRPDGLGYRASFVELLVQVGLLSLAGSAVYANPTARRAAAAVGVGVVAAALSLFTIPVYGEAFVAP